MQALLKKYEVYNKNLKSEMEGDQINFEWIVFMKFDNDIKGRLKFINKIL